ncbi:PEP-CTERM sorting domain-containing protein [Rhodoferax sp. U11-2br]|uniref:PEP-CTERM sorting domain-containing protein n=1 Tax=Rhodoferax sp. U11-2br TaxID=2838878 RepID=UPI001BE67F9E|nr:PEP-CTERM sorting domain-containing protein [Rhodoferax sp. U11-2br]MBT3069162.1 PEP-CTERM sorting domain-containing protein [Rhodoferax sp. U11-2br]
MMTSLFKKMTVALALVGALGAASASVVPVNLGTLNDTLTYSADISGPFEQVLSFKADKLLGADARLVMFDFMGDIGGSYSFGFGSSLDSVTWLDALNGELVAVDDFVSAYSLELPVLTAGETYWFRLVGEVSDASYTFKVAPFSVPEPGSMALVLLGAGGMAFVARRRSNLTDKKGA